MFSMPSRIRRARILARLTQAELARRLGVQRSAVTQWECDGGTHPSVVHLAAIASETRVCFEWLATGRGECQPADGTLDTAVTIQDFARDDLESRALLSLRRVSRQKRETVVRVIELFALQS